MVQRSANLTRMISVFSSLRMREDNYSSKAQVGHPQDACGIKAQGKREDQAHKASDG